MRPRVLAAQPPHGAGGGGGGLSADGDRDGAADALPTAKSNAASNAAAHRAATAGNRSAERRQRLRAWLWQWVLWWTPLPRRPYWIWIFALVAVVFHVLGFYFLRPFYGQTGEREQQRAALVYLDPVSQQSVTLAEHSSLLDFEPLFLPTGWNAEPERLSLFDRSKRTEPYAPYGAELSGMMLRLPPAQTPVLPKSAQQALEMDSGAIFSTFGRNIADAIRLDERQARIQIESLSALRPQGFVDVQPGSLEIQPGGSLGVGVFLIEVDNTGSVSLPLLRRSTGLDARDRLWLEYLYREVPVWDLGAGTYRLTVGP